MPDIAPAAPAQPAAIDTPAPTISATRDAANKGDFASFDSAHISAQRGTPLPRIDAPADPAKPDTAAPAAPAAPQVSKRQQQINDYERRIAEQAAEIARLKTPAPFPPAPRSEAPAPAAPAQPEPKAAEWKRLIALPNAPKLADFDSVEEHAAAMAWFVNQTLTDERATADRQRTAQTQTDAYRHEQMTAFDTRVEALVATDPEIVTKIVPIAQQLGALAQHGGPARTLSDMVLESEVGPQLLNHFREHPDALTTLLTPPAATRGLPVDAQVRAHITHFTREFHRLESSFSGPAPAAEPTADLPSTITAAPAPPATVTRAGSTADPKKAALARGDFATFDKLEMADKTRKRGAA